MLLTALGMLSLGASVWAQPTGADHARKTHAAFLADFADPLGAGILDGIRSTRAATLNP